MSETALNREIPDMAFVIACIVAVALLAYLVYALLHPEKLT